MSTTTPEPGDNSGNPATRADSEDEISLLDLLRVLWEHKWLLIGSTLGAGVLAAGIALLMPNYYTATARILPPQQNSSSASALLGQLGGLAAAAGGNIAGIRNPNDLYVGMLKSRTVADRIIEKFELKTYFDEKYKMTTRARLAKASRISAGRDGIIEVAVELKDARLAADVANAYIDELINLSALLAVTEAAQRRLFLERQLSRVRNNLATVEAKARDAFAKGGLSVAESHGRSLVEASARLRAQITSKEVQIGAMRAYATENNPDIKLARMELAALETELARVEGAGQMPSKLNQTSGSSDNVHLLRELRYLEVLQDLLLRQTEAARIDEARESAVVQVLDSADVSDTKSSPSRGLIAFSAMLLALALSVGAVLVVWAFGGVIEKAPYKGGNNRQGLGL